MSIFERIISRARTEESYVTNNTIELKLVDPDGNRVKITLSNYERKVTFISDQLTNKIVSVGCYFSRMNNLLTVTIPSFNIRFTMSISRGDNAFPVLF